MRSAQVLVTLTETDEDSDIRVNLERVGGDQNAWAMRYVANMLADDDDALESVELANGITVRAGDAE